MQYIVVRLDEPVWDGRVFADTREAFDYAKTRAESEGKSIGEYVIKPLEVWQSVE